MDTRSVLLTSPERGAGRARGGQGRGATGREVERRGRGERRVRREADGGERPIGSRRNRPRATLGPSSTARPCRLRADRRPRRLPWPIGRASRPRRLGRADPGDAARVPAPGSGRVGPHDGARASHDSERSGPARPAGAADGGQPQGQSAAAGEIRHRHAIRRKRLVRAERGFRQTGEPRASSREPISALIGRIDRDRIAARSRSCKVAARLQPGLPRLAALGREPAAWPRWPAAAPDCARSTCASGRRAEGDRRHRPERGRRHRPPRAAAEAAARRPGDPGACASRRKPLATPGDRAAADLRAPTFRPLAGDRNPPAATKGERAVRPPALWRTPRRSPPPPRVRASPVHDLLPRGVPAPMRRHHPYGLARRLGDLRRLCIPGPSKGFGLERSRGASAAAERRRTAREGNRSAAWMGRGPAGRRARVREARLWPWRGERVRSEKAPHGSSVAAVGIGRSGRCWRDRARPVIDGTGMAISALIRRGIDGRGKDVGGGDDDRTWSRAGSGKRPGCGMRLTSAMRRMQGRGADRVHSRQSKRAAGVACGRRCPPVRVGSAGEPW